MNITLWKKLSHKTFISITRLFRASLFIGIFSTPFKRNNQFLIPKPKKFTFKYLIQNFWKRIINNRQRNMGLVRTNRSIQEIIMYTTAFIDKFYKN